MIRPFAQDDMDAALNVWLRASIRSHPFIPQEYWLARVGFIRDSCLPRCLSLVFIDDEHATITGFAALSGDILGGLFVAPEQQGRGIGSRLFSLMQRICPGLRLSVYTENIRAIEFYRKKGLQTIGHRIDPDTGHEETLMIAHKNIP